MAGRVLFVKKIDEIRQALVDRLLAANSHEAREKALKSGAHLWALPALLAEYPDAVLVQTHRDPLRVVASLSSLFASIRGTGSDDASIADPARAATPPTTGGRGRTDSSRSSRANLVAQRVTGELDQAERRVGRAARLPGRAGPNPIGGAQLTCRIR